MIWTWAGEVKKSDFWNFPSKNNRFHSLLFSPTQTPT